MKSTLLRWCLLLLCAAAALTLTGCSPEAKKARHLRKANAHFAKGLYDAAEIEYLNALQYDGLNPEAIVQLGAIYFDQSRVGRVFPFLLKSRELNPNNMDARGRLAMFMLSVGRLKDAREEALFVLEHRPTDREAPLVLAESVADTAELENTLQRFAALPPATQESPPVLVAKGMLEFRQRHVSEAQALFDKAVTIDPNYSPAHIGLANVAWSRNEASAAETAFATAARVAPLRSPRKLQYPKFCIQAGKKEAAREYLDRLTKESPDFMAAWILLADLAAADKRYDDSLAAVQKVLARDFNHPEAMLLSARVRLAKGENQKALLELERAVNAYPQSPQLNHQLALAYIANQDLVKASAAAAQAVALAPKYIEAVMLHAEITLRLGHYATAVPLLRQLVQQEPTFVPAHLLLAQGLRAQGSWDEALETYRNLDRAQPRDPQLQLLMGAVLLQKNEPKAARSLFERALEYAPNFLPAVEQLVNLDILEKKFDQARARVEPLIEQSPETGSLHLLLAKVLLAESNVRGAESSLLRSAQLQPDLPLTYFLLAKVYLGFQQPEKAIAQLESAANKDPKDVQSRMMLGILHERQKNYDAARKAYEQALAINPRFAAALNNLAYLCSEQFHDLDRAFGYAQKAREAQPGEPHIADTLGWILYKKRQFSWAVSLLKESAEALPTSAEVIFHLGMNRYMLGQEVPAKEHLTKALELSQDFVGAAQAREALSIIAIDPRAAESSVVAMLVKREANDPIAAIRLGQIREAAGDIAQALASYERALNVNPDNVGAALGVVRLLTARHEFDRAMTVAKATRKLVPEDIDVAIALGRLAYDGGDEAWAASLLQEAVRARPKDAALVFDFARALYATGQVEDARANAQEALRVSPDADFAPKALQFLELTDSQHSDTGALTLPALQALVAADVRNAPAWMRIGQLAEARGDRAVARHAYNQALAVHRQFLPAMKRLTLLVAEEGELTSEAVDLANRVRSALQSDPEVAKALGIISFRSGKSPRALTLLTEASRQLSSDATVLYYLGLAQVQVKDNVAGTKALERALELGLKPAYAAEAQKHLRTKQP